MGGLLQGMGIIAQLMNIISSFVKTSTRLIISTASTAIGVNFLLGEQYLSIVLTGQAFANKYDEVGLERRNLSRVLEDAGTVINPLVPWGVSGVFLTNVLSVPTFDYLPYAIFCLACPVVTIIVGFTGFGLSWKKRKKQYQFHNITKRITKSVILFIFLDYLFAFFLLNNRSNPAPTNARPAPIVEAILAPVFGKSRSSFFSFFIFTYSCCFFCILIICCSLSRSSIVSILLWFITIITFFCWRCCWVFSITFWWCRRIFSTTCWRCCWVSFTSFFIIIFSSLYQLHISQIHFQMVQHMKSFHLSLYTFCAFGEESNVVFNLSATIGLNVQF